MRKWIIAALLAVTLGLNLPATAQVAPTTKVVTPPVQQPDARMPKMGDGMISMNAMPGAQPMVGVKDVLTGVAFPLTMHLKDMNATWTRLTTGGVLDTGDISAALTAMMGGVPTNVYYTRGDSVTMSGVNYLVTYRRQIKTVSLMALVTAIAKTNGNAMPPLDKFLPAHVTPDTLVTLSLLNLQTSGTLNDLRPYNIDTEIADTNSNIPDPEGLAALMNMANQMGTMMPNPGAHPKPKQ